MIYLKQQLCITCYSDMPPVVKHYLEQLLAEGAENTYYHVSTAGFSM